MNMNASLHRDGRLTFALLLTVSALLLIFNQAAIAAVKKPVLVKLTPLQIFCAANAQARVTDPEMPASLKCTPAPEPYMLDSSGKKVSLASSIIKNNTVAIALGKMWFWESQSGSDGLACASCHFQAGADNRTKNQINSGFRNATSKTASDNKTAIGNLFDFMASDPNISKLDPLHPAKGKGPNYTLKKTDFPLRQYQEPDAPADGQPLQADRHAKIIYDSDDVISSQGAFHSTFKGLTPTAQEKCTATFPESGPFNVGGQSVRQVEPRNTPTVINAVYNFRNFWDGRANNVFNGLDPFGLRRFANPALTPAGEIYKKDAKGKLVKTRVAIYNASLASQALGPPLSDMEMSCAGKKFPDLARKMLALKPLGKQKVDVTDSVLGTYAMPNGDIKLANTYKLMIQSAFNNDYWDLPDKTTIDGYKLIENNFSLFWGLAIQAYEATLVSDDSRFDQSIDGRGKLSSSENNGLNLFFGQGKCVACHSGAEFTTASVSHVENAQNTPDIGKYILRMLMGDGGMALYDDGYYNIGVRPAAEDQGVGANDPYGYPLSFTRNAKLKTNKIGDPQSSLSPDPFKTDSTLFAANLGSIAWNPETSSGGMSGTDPVVSDERDAVDGAFKSPTLRNAELTGPFFHNGGFATLTQVVEFYNRGGDRKDLYQQDSDCGGAKMTVDNYGNPIVLADDVTGLIDDSGFVNGTSGYASNISPDLAGTKNLLDTTCSPGQQPQETLMLSNNDVSDLVAFIKSLTDERVRWEKAPFDHPSLTMPNGHMGNESGVIGNPAKDELLVLPAVGAKGRKLALKPFEVGLK